ncbi:MAG: DUF488 domain-containing protein [Desulfobacterota bacterium]|nr:DUF488 domain-containing protein [Thermodesulfobacteriota bacterium]
MRACATIGHSDHRLEAFINILRSYAIDTLIDIRSVPYSRRHPQFNRESLKTDLQLHDIRYLYLGDRLGGRQTDQGVLLPDGRVDFIAVRKLPSFQEGIHRVIAEIEQGFTVALLCAEKEPFDCHRFMLVSPALAEQGIILRHIIDEQRSITQHELEEQLLQKYGLNSRQPSLFEQQKSRQNRLDEAYALLAKKIKRRTG